MMSHTPAERPTCAQILIGNQWKIDAKEINTYCINNEISIDDGSDNFFVTYFRQKSSYFKSINHFKYRAFIGEGAFGKVSKYLNVLDRNNYAIKSIKIPGERNSVP